MGFPGLSSRRSPMGPSLGPRRWLPLCVPLGRAAAAPRSLAAAFRGRGSRRSDERSPRCPPAYAERCGKAAGWMPVGFVASLPSCLCRALRESCRVDAGRVRRLIALLLMQSVAGKLPGGCR
ncbi:hypothetical protein NDU88_007482 [Pleurodeles waltl]|uniref:Secreted protein n=1 Tax=Pleurodeles waltl TaxID=8319 RepID=A0AAV7VT12_PLEWA|nr:hypothetical protein NDU88_007482 [Pleurodeles waltl]